MKTFQKIFTVTIFALVFAFAAQAKTVQITDFGAIANDDTDDTEAVRVAVLDLVENGGGTLIFPAGVTDIQDEISITGRQLVNFRLSGDKGSFVKLNGNQDTNYFVFDRAIQIEIENLNFIGNTDVLINAQRVIWAKDVEQTKVSGCGFFDIGATEAIVEFRNTKGSVRDSIFGGSAAQTAAVTARSAKGLLVENTSFKNEFEYLNTTARKAADMNPQHWIKVENPAAIGSGIVRISDSVFETAAQKSIRIEDQSAVTFEGIIVSVSMDKFAVGVSLKNVGYAEALNSTFGSATRPRPAFEVRSNSYLEINGVTLKEQVKLGNFDSNSSCQIRYCPTCGIAPARPKK